MGDGTASSTEGRRPVCDQVVRDIDSIWHRVKQQRKCSDIRWHSSLRPAEPGAVLEVPLDRGRGDLGEDTHSSQQAWLAKRRVKLNALMARIQTDSNKLQATDILKILPSNEIVRLKARFDNCEEEGELGVVGKDAFLVFMLDALRVHRKVSDQEEQELKEGLEALFFAIDFDGSGFISWEEFTHYLVNSYAVARRTNEFLPYEIQKAEVTGRFPSKGSNMHWVAGLNRLLTIDTADRSVVRVFSPDDIQEPSAVLEHPCQLLSHAYLPQKAKFVFGTEGGGLDYYVYKPDSQMHLAEVTEPVTVDFSTNQRRRAQSREKSRLASLARQRLKHVSHVQCEAASLVLHYDDEMTSSGLLFSGTRVGEVYVYDVATHEESCKHPEVVGHQRSHSEPISCLSTLPGLFSTPRKLVTASFFGKVTLTDLEKDITTELKGAAPSHRHHQGVYCVDHSPSMNILLTSGFETEPIVWAPTQAHNQYVERLKDSEDPHKHSLLGARIIPGTNQIVSCDSSGCFKMWDLRKWQCMQTWYLQRGMTTLQAKAFGVASFVMDPAADTHSLYCTAKTDTNDLKLYTLVPQVRTKQNSGVTHDKRVVDIRYNAATQTFITAAATEVKIWDAATGTVHLNIFDVADDEITSLALDGMGRRFLVGTHCGGLTVHSYATGALTQTFSGFTTEVTCILYLTHHKHICASSIGGEIHLYQDDEDAVYPHQQIRCAAGVVGMVYSPHLHILCAGDVRDSYYVYDMYSCLSVNMLCKSTWESRGGDGGGPEGGVGMQMEKYMHPAVSEVTCVLLLDPLPALVYACDNGALRMVTVRPHGTPYTLLSQWKTPDAKANSLVTTVTTAIAWCYSANQSVVAGDDHGHIAVWDMREVVVSASLEPTCYPPLVWDTAGCPQAPGDRRKKPRLLKRWSASQQPIARVAVVPRVDVVVVAATELVTLYTLDGVLLGRLAQGRDSSGGPAGLPPYEFTLDPQELQSMCVFKRYRKASVWPQRQEAGPLTPEVRTRSEAAPDGVGGAALPREGRVLWGCLGEAVRHSNENRLGETAGGFRPILELLHGAKENIVVDQEVNTPPASPPRPPPPPSSPLPPPPGSPTHVAAMSPRAGGGGGSLTQGARPPTAWRRVRRQARAAYVALAEEAEAKLHGAVAAAAAALEVELEGRCEPGAGVRVVRDEGWFEFARLPLKKYAVASTYACLKAVPLHEDAPAVPTLEWMRAEAARIQEQPVVHAFDGCSHSASDAAYAAQAALEALEAASVQGRGEAGNLGDLELMRWQRRSTVCSTAFSERRATRSSVCGRRRSTAASPRTACPASAAQPDLKDVFFPQETASVVVDPAMFGDDYGAADDVFCYVADAAAAAEAASKVTGQKGAFAELLHATPNYPLAESPCLSLNQRVPLRAPPLPPALIFAARVPDEVAAGCVGGRGGDLAEQLADAAIAADEAEAPPTEEPPSAPPARVPTFVDDDGGGGGGGGRKEAGILPGSRSGSLRGQGFRERLNNNTPTGGSGRRRSTLRQTFEQLNGRIAVYSAYAGAVAVLLSTLPLRRIVAAMGGHLFCEEEHGMSLCSERMDGSLWIGYIKRMSCEAPWTYMHIDFHNTGGAGSTAPPKWPVVVPPLDADGRRVLIDLGSCASRYDIDCSEVQELVLGFDEARDTMTLVDRRHSVAAGVGTASSGAAAAAAEDLHFREHLVTVMRAKGPRQSCASSTTPPPPQWQQQQQQRRNSGVTARAVDLSPALGASAKAPPLRPASSGTVRRGLTTPGYREAAQHGAAPFDPEPAPIVQRKVPLPPREDEEVQQGGGEPLPQPPHELPPEAAVAASPAEKAYSVRDIFDEAKKAQDRQLRAAQLPRTLAHRLGSAPVRCTRSPAPQHPLELAPSQGNAAGGVAAPALRLCPAKKAAVGQLAKGIAMARPAARHDAGGAPWPRAKDSLPPDRVAFKFKRLSAAQPRSAFKRGGSLRLGKATRRESAAAATAAAAPLKNPPRTFEPPLREASPT